MKHTQRTSSNHSGRSPGPWLTLGLTALAQVAPLAPLAALQPLDADLPVSSRVTGAPATRRADDLPRTTFLEVTSSLDKMTQRLVHPPDGESRTRRFVTLMWMPDIGGGATAYEIELNGKTMTVSGAHSFDTLLAVGAHTWRVRSLGGAGEWSDPWSFEILPTPPYEDNERTVFFDDFVAKTLIRTAWSPLKWETIGTTFERELELHGLRAEFSAADSPKKMLRAVHKLNYLRKDNHLDLSATAEVIDNRFAPIKFYPDLADESHPFFFVTNLTAEVSRLGVNRGDRLIAVNGIPAAEYLWMLEPYLRGSTRRHVYLKEAPLYLSAKNALFGPELYAGSETVTYLLENQQTGEWYDATLGYEFESAGLIHWQYAPAVAGDRAENVARFRNFYERFGFESAFDNELDAALYLNRNLRVAVIEWYDLEDTEQSINDLVAAAAREGALDYDVIVDGTHGSGGTGSELVVRVLANAPFKNTFGNVRVDDVEFATRKKGDHGPAVEAWIDDAIAEGRSYTTNEPFKLLNFPRGSDGVMDPATERFTGDKVMLFFPWGGSNLDQFASMVEDNPETGIHTIGMTMGGYSNTWEWGETLEVPGVGPVFFEWDIGHTIRPNGEILEGNPSLAAEWIPFSRDNFDRYFELLMTRALEHLGHQWAIP